MDHTVESLKIEEKIANQSYLRWEVWHVTYLLFTWHTDIKSEKKKKEKKTIMENTKNNEFWIKRGLDFWVKING